MADVGSRTVHVPVMVQELVRGLQVVPGGLYVDATVGGGGHAQAVREASSPGGRVPGVDAGPRASRNPRRRPRGVQGA